MGGVLVLLAAATVVIRALRARNDSGLNTAILETFRMRVHAWWVLCSILAATFFIGQTATVVLFGPGRLLGPAGVHHAHAHAARRPPHAVQGLLRHHALAVRARGHGDYPLYSIMIPVYAFLIIPALIAMAGDYKRFLERTAKIEAGLLICVYCLSYAPALLDAATRVAGADVTPGPTPGCCSSSCSWSSSATPCNTPGPRSPAGT